MSHASGEGHSFAIRPVAMRPDDYKIVAERLTADLPIGSEGSQQGPACEPRV